MRIVLCPSAYFPSLGGVEELTGKLALEYKKRGHHVEVLVNKWPSNLHHRESILGVDVTRVSFRVPGLSVRVLLSFVLFGWMSILQTIIFGLRFKPDVIHVVCSSTNLTYAVFLSKFMRKPLVVTAQGEIGMDASRVYQGKSFVPLTFSQLVRQSSWITACSSSTREELLKYANLNRCTVVRNGISMMEFSQLQANPRSKCSRKYVFAMGRHVHQKGFDVLIRAWYQLQLQDFDLVIGGSGTDTDLLQELISDLNLNDSVHLIGRLDRTGVVSHLQHATCFVLPSRHEPFGIVVLEAMAARTPVIATAVGGVPEFVTDGINGRLVPDDNVNAMAQALHELIVNGASQTHISAGYATAVEHDWPSIASEYLNIYSKCIAGEVQV